MPAPTLLPAILWGGLAAGVGDSILALVLYRVPLKVIYQSVAAGLLGRAAYRGGLTTAALGCALHFFIATTAAAAYVTAARWRPVLVRYAAGTGLAFGAAVYFVMKYVVLPLSAVPRLTPFDARALVGHMLLVGLPIALVARRCIGARDPASGRAAAPAVAAR